MKISCSYCSIKNESKKQYELLMNLSELIQKSSEKYKNFLEVTCKKCNNIL